MTIPWRPSDALALQTGIAAVSRALSRITGETPDTAYQRVFGGVTFYLSWSLAFYGYATESRVGFRPGRVTPRLVAHELGHIFAIRNPKVLNAVAVIAVPASAFQPGTQSHPAWMLGGLRPAEKWADTFQAFVFSTFANNEDGRMLCVWVEDHLGTWLESD